MKLNGSISTPCPPENVLPFLHDPVVLAKIAPEGFVFAQRASGQVLFSFQRRIGVLILKLSGKLTLRDMGDEAKSRVDILAEHRFGGSVMIGLDVTPQIGPDGAQTLAWSGTMEASGLAARIVKQRESEAHKIVTTLIERLADQAATA